MTKQTKFITRLLMGGLVLAGLQACNHDEDSDEDVMSEMSKFKVTVSNVTSGQPLTPVAVVFHKSGFTPWQIGMPASVGLEELAEGGDPSVFIDEVMADSSVLATKVSDGGAFGPGGEVNLEIDVDEEADLHFSMASMLANTNDAFASINSKMIGEMEVGDTMTLMSMAYDAGTEANSEMSGTVAGPADDSSDVEKGFNDVRDDMNDFVTLHPGVVTKDDGIEQSILNESHRWNGPVAKIVLEKME